MEDAKDEAGELNGVTISPKVGTSGVGTMIQQFRTAIGLAKELGATIDASKAKAASMLSPNAEGSACPGRVTQAFANSLSVGEAWCSLACPSTPPI